MNASASSGRDGGAPGSPRKARRPSPYADKPYEVGKGKPPKHSQYKRGEALDDGDKGTAKAMSAAYKAAMLQAFCIPVTGTEDADASTGTIVTKPSVLTGEPVEGWEQWTKDVMYTLGICESIEAVDRVQLGKRPQLRAISRERPELYATLGDCFSQRRQALLATEGPPKKARKPYVRRDKEVVSNDRKTNFVLVEA